MTHRYKRSQVKNDEYFKEKKHALNSNKDGLDEETKLVKRKLESERARKRTRGPYRKSLVN
ncbi:MAG TPA: hypothetical protein VJ599_10320 [Nitrososphaeraceae archaeon]|nr:hypothetical protein [Nitrososphaeraceae archaeon]